MVVNSPTVSMELQFVPIDFGHETRSLEDEEQQAYDRFGFLIENQVRSLNGQILDGYEGYWEEDEEFVKIRELSWEIIFEDWKLGTLQTWKTERLSQVKNKDDIEKKKKKRKKN
jgi:hypothetical protein